MYFYYRTISNFMSWAHHVGYLIAMGYSLICNCPMIFVVFLPVEFSTVFLAIGHIWPKYRQDLAFGVSFFACRVLYHGLLVAFLLVHRKFIPHIIFTIGASMSWLTHIDWFYKWYKSYTRKERKGSVKLN
jgi:hypothetical protein